jgi:hypothetical protein
MIRAALRSTCRFDATGPWPGLTSSHEDAVEHSRASEWIARELCGRLYLTDAAAEP